MSIPLNQSGNQSALGMIQNQVAGLAPFGQQIASVIQGLSQLFGPGRREADLISPVQNQFGSFLANVNQSISDPSISLAQLQTLYTATQTAWREFDTFLRDPRFTDGRAPRQARDTILPLVNGTLASIQRLIDAKPKGILGFLPGNVAGAAGEGNSSLLLIAGGVILAKILKIL